MSAGPPAFRHPLAYVRYQRGWTLSDVAELVQSRSGLNMATRREKVWRWENGRAVPELPTQLALAEELGIAAQIVLEQPWPAWLLLADGTEPVDSPWTVEAAQHVLVRCMDGDMDRRSFLLLSGDAAIALADAWASIPVQKVVHAEQGGRVDGEIANWIDGRIEQLWHLDDLVGGDHCLGLVKADLQLIQRMLKQSRYNDTIGDRLYGAAGELCRFAGWSAFDSDHAAAAERYWHAGLRTSAQGGDAMTGAYILSQMAMQRTYAGDGRTAVGLLEAARDKIGRGASRTVHAMLDAWQVRAHAVAGESHQALRLLSRADQHWEHRDPDEDPAWIYWMRRPSTTIEVGMALVDIGQPATAVRMLEEGMVERTEDYARDSALGMAAIADAQLGHRNLDGALDTARRAAELVAHIGSNRVVDQLRAFAGKLPSSEPEAEEFRHYLDGLVASG